MVPEAPPMTRTNPERATEVDFVAEALEAEARALARIVERLVRHGRDPDALFDWATWLAPNGLDPAVLGDGPVFSDASMCLDAAIAGQGVFLAWETLAHDAIRMGRLVAPFPGRYPTGIAYWFVTGRQRGRSPRIRAFRDWLEAALATSIGDG